jgi:hypothetical protein
MTYQVEFERAALVQLNGLPSTAFDALVERVVALVKEGRTRQRGGLDVLPEIMAVLPLGVAAQI